MFWTRMIRDFKGFRLREGACGGWFLPVGATSIRCHLFHVGLGLEFPTRVRVSG